MPRFLFALINESTSNGYVHLEISVTTKFMKIKF